MFHFWANSYWKRRRSLRKRIWPTESQKLLCRSMLWPALGVFSHSISFLPHSTSQFLFGVFLFNDHFSCLVSLGKLSLALVKVEQGRAQGFRPHGCQTYLVRKLITETKGSNWLVVEPTPLKNITQLGWFFPIYGKKCSKPPTSLRFELIFYWSLGCWPGTRVHPMSISSPLDRSQQNFPVLRASVPDSDAVVGVMSSCNISARAGSLSCWELLPLSMFGGAPVRNR